jgi:hypothetical protein
MFSTCVIDINTDSKMVDCVRHNRHPKMFKFVALEPVNTLFYIAKGLFRHDKLRIIK